MARLSWALLLGAVLLRSGNAQGIERTYIVQMESTSATGQSSIARRSAHESSLRAVTPRDTMLYSYSSAMNGYAARLTETQARELMAQPGIKSVSRQKIYQLHTTHSPEFLGLDSAELLGQQTPVFSGTDDPTNTTAGADSESDLVIGVFDTGVWPESASYDDTGLPPIPSRWKGSCVEGEQFTAANCNKKLIGAKWFSKGLEAGWISENNGTAYNFTGAYLSARDPDGHGTHTSSTAAGAVVQNASLFGQASGTARGMAFKARVAMYKVCWPNGGCADADILAAMDEAIKDGINVASLSLGGEPDLGANPVYVGAFSAMAQGIFVSMSGGNSGPGAGTVSNNVPWVLTVGASTQDRGFPATAVLGNGQNFTGKSLSVNEDGSLPGFQELPLILASEAANGNVTNGTDASLCLAGTLSPTKVADKIVVCIRGGNARVAKGQAVKDAGGAGMILVNTEETGEDVLADPHVLPAVQLGASNMAAVVAYAKSTDATAGLDIKGTVMGIEAPLMAAFSSRGPNYPAPDLLKPDITGPGVEILAAWPDNLGTTGLPDDTRRVKFNIISGTSMSCPHLSGIAAFIMARRPEWSAAAIRSALMTTAYTSTKGSDSLFRDEATQDSATPFAYGNGHVNVAAALDPGLIYDIKTDDYFDFLCALNSTTEYVQGVSGTNSTCSADKTYSAYNLNYPSFAVGYDTKIETGPKTVNFTRTVTNLGEASTYHVNVSLSNPDLVQVSVDPEELNFTEAKEQKTFTVSVTLASAGAEADSGKSSWGRLVWSDGSHTVGSSLGFVWGDLAALSLNASTSSTSKSSF